jgi:hypothetical protein
MRFGPKAGRNGQRINLPLFPPGALIALPVQFTVVQSADWDGEPVADLPPHRPLLSELDVVRIRWSSTADKAGLGGHELQMLAVALRYGFAQDGDLLRAGIVSHWLVATPIRLLVVRFRCWRCLAEVSKPRSKCSFDGLSICSGELVLEGEGAVRPRGKGLGIFELLNL